MEAPTLFLLHQRQCPCAHLRAPPPSLAFSPHLFTGTPAPPSPCHCGLIVFKRINIPTALGGCKHVTAVGAFAHLHEF